LIWHNVCHSADAPASASADLQAKVDPQSDEEASGDRGPSAQELKDTCMRLVSFFALFFFCCEKLTESYEYSQWLPNMVSKEMLLWLGKIQIS
jgi:hypothetical protein